MKVIVGEQEVDLNPEILNFSEATLNEYLTKDSAYYSYFHAKMVEAQAVMSKYEDEYDYAYYRMYHECKEAGNSDKMAEARAKSNKEVISLKDKIREAKKVKDYIWGFLRSLDKAHENALNLGWNVRKETQIFQQNHVKSLEDIIN